MEIEKPFNQVDKIELHMFSKYLSNHLPDDAILVTDSGLVELILPSNVAFSNSQRCLHPSSQGSMGYALPAAIGASFASKKDIFVVVGDGSIMMNLQELQTIKFNELPIKLFVLNNNAYSIIRKRQNELFRGRTIGTDSSNGLDCPDFNKIADSFGFDYMKIMNHKELEKFGPTVIKSNRPILCELIGYEDQNYVQISPFKDDKGAIKKGLLEHQSPFI
jgi:acetolactate synthase-1/2/3 large subunit